MILLVVPCCDVEYGDSFDTRDLSARREWPLPAEPRTPLSNLVEWPCIESECDLAEVYRISHRQRYLVIWVP